MKKVLVITGIILVILCAALFVLALVSAGGDFSKIGAYETNTHVVAGNFDGIKINTALTDVVFKPSEDGSVSVVCVEKEKMKHRVAVENGALEITAEDRREWFDRVTLYSKPLSVTVYLPSGAYGALEISSRTGDVSVPSGFTFGSIDVTASTGDVFCSASAGGRLKITTTTGDVSLDELSAASVVVSVSTGRVKATGISCAGETYVNVTTGKAELSDLSCSALYSKGSTGDVTLNRVTASTLLNVERSTGDIRFGESDAPEVTFRTTTGDINGTFLTGKTFVPSTSTGRIDVPGTSGGRCELTTSTGDIKVSVTG
ncbi:MAG: DUF4097 family beta strand repeat protein [Clostridia bacterium]|nr:DUF4097 family beta strand repeat protein [Clostridia bacterium]